MNGDINQYLERIINLRNEISLINNDINIKREEFAKLIEQLNYQINIRRRELDMLQENAHFPVRLGDLIFELSNFSGLDIHSIDVSLKTNVMFLGSYNFVEMVNLYKNSKKNYYIRMQIDSKETNGKDIKFSYFSFLPIDFNAIQEDGKTLLEHCSLVTTEMFDGNYTEIVIDKDIDDVILYFDLSYLQMNETVSWYPADLFTQVIINCINKGINSSYSLVKSK